MTLMLISLEAWAAALEPLFAISASDEIRVPISVAGAMGATLLGRYVWLEKKLDRYETWMREESARKDKLYDELMASVRREADREHR